jgi:hypothetical protein
LGVALTILFFNSAVAWAQLVPERLEPYPLPSKAQQALGELAAESDVLILGEIHGTQEVPAVAAALLAPLSKLGYGVLALEIPADQQGPLADWATGKTQTVPDFFAKPFPDGRGSIQTLSLIRTALSTPFRWKLICFDWSEENAAAEALGAEGKRVSSFSADDSIGMSARRDAAMAANLANQRARLAPDAKILAICGGLHARTSNRQRSYLPQDNITSKLWPSFAAALQAGHSTWRVQSVNVVPRSGGFFAMMAVEGGEPPSGGKVHTIRATRQLNEAEAHPLADEAWNLELNLPRATPATFLATPSAAAPPVADPALREELLKREEEDQAIRNELISKGVEQPDKSILARMTEIDAANTERMKAIVQQHGWPSRKLVGSDGAHAAFLLVQHADPAFQKEMLPLVEKAYKSGSLSGQSYALLLDRVLVREGKPQMYGTQAKPFEEWKDGQVAAMPIEDEANVDKRRAEVGLPPLSEYLKMMKQVYFPQGNGKP